MFMIQEKLDEGGIGPLTLKKPQNFHTENQSGF